MSFIIYVTESLKVIVWSRWDRLSLVFEENDSKMRFNEIFVHGSKIIRGVLDDFLYK